MFEENVMDVILVLTQHVEEDCGFIRQDKLLLLEIFYYVFLGRDPEVVAKSFKKGSQVFLHIEPCLSIFAQKPLLISEIPLMLKTGTWINFFLELNL